MTYAELIELTGQEIGLSSWLAVDQALIDNFARLSGDDGFIHVDAVRAAATPFRTTIAHGLLTLALSGGMLKEVLPQITDRAFLVNYGYDKIRWLEPVPVSSRIRARFQLIEARVRTDKERLLRLSVAVERESSTRPAMIAELLLMVVLN
jgi:acyl dehydratase